MVSVESINYIDANGDTQDLLNAQVSTGELSCITLDYGETWPTTRRRKKAVSIEYTSGKSRPPGNARRAMLLLIAEWFDNRDSREIPKAAWDLIVGIRPGDEFTNPIGGEANRQESAPR